MLMHLVEVILSAGSVLLEVRLSSARIHVSIREDDEEVAAEVAATLVGAEAPDDEVTSDAELDEAGTADIVSDESVSSDDGGEKAIGIFSNRANLERFFARRNTTRAARRPVRVRTKKPRMAVGRFSSDKKRKRVGTQPILTIVDRDTVFPVNVPPSSILALPVAPPGVVFILSQVPPAGHASRA